MSNDLICREFNLAVTFNPLDALRFIEHDFKPIGGL